MKWRLQPRLRTPSYSCTMARSGKPAPAICCAIQKHQNCKTFSPPNLDQLLYTITFKPSNFILTLTKGKYHEIYQVTFYGGSCYQHSGTFRRRIGGHAG